MSEALSYVCPFCNRNVRVGKPCSGCATKQRSPKPSKKSWQSESTEDGLSLPDEDFDYDDFVAREFGKTPHRQLGVKWYWWLLGVIVLAAMISGIVAF